MAKEIVEFVNKRRKKEKRRAEEDDAEDGPEAIIAAQETANAMDLEGVHAGQKFTLNEDLFESSAG